MRKLASVIDDIVSSTKAEQLRIKEASLSNSVQEPIISTELGQALVKVAAALRDTQPEVTFDDVRHLLGQVKSHD